MLIGAILPPLTRELALPDWTAGAIFSLSALLWAFFSPFWRSLSNRLGRRPVIAIGLIGYATSTFLFAFVAYLSLQGVITNWFWIFVCLLLSRGISGIVGPGVPTASQAYIADRTTPEARTAEIAMLGSGMTLGAALGPAAAAAIIASMGLLTPLFFIGFIVVGLAVWVFLKLPENRPPKTTIATSSTSISALKDPAIGPFIIFGVGLSMCTGILVQTFPFAMMDRMQIEGPQASQFLAAAMTIGAMATLISQLVLIPRLRLSPRNFTLLGVVPILIFAASMLFAADLGTFCLIQLMLGIGMGLARPGFTSGASLAGTPEQQGEVAGLIVATNGLGFVVSPLFGLWAYEHISPYAPFCVVIVIMSAVAAIIALKTHEPSQTA